MQRTTVIFLLIALLLPSASAQDFLAFGDTAINTFPCGSTTSNITIQNTRENQATYSLSIDGTGSDYITFSSLNFALNQGQSALINTFYNIPCTTRPGTYLVDIFFNDGEVEKTLTQEIIIAIPDNVNVTTQQTSAVIAPCETAGYTLQLSNPLNFTEIYTISASGHSNIHVSEKRAVLTGDENKNIIVSVTPDDCTQSGTFPLTVEISTEKSNQKKDVALELIIKSTDIPILAEGINKIRTDYTDSTADLTIENTGDRETQYGLMIEGAPWASISPSSVTLNPGQQKTINLRLTPTEQIPEGSYPITLTATVEQTGIKYSKELTIKLQKPTLFEKNPTLVVAIAVVILAILIGMFYTVRYFRSPAFKEKMRRWKEKREAKRKAREQKRAELLKRKLEQQRKNLERKQAERERLKKQLEREFKKEYHVVARKDIVIGKKKKQPLKIIAIILGVLILLLIGAAWSLIEPNFQYVLLGLAILGVIFIAKQMSRARVIKARWKMLLEKQTVTLKAWKKGLSLLSITAKKPIKQFKILIRKTKARIAPSPAVYQSILVKTNTEEASLKATFTVSKAWLARKKVGVEEVRLARYANQAWNTIQLKKTGESKDAIHFTAEIKEGTYSIYARVKKQPIRARKIIWGIIGIALITAIAIVIAPQPATTIAHGIPPQTWQENTVHQIDLDKYFKDPDADKLSYTSTEIKHITIDIVNNTAILTPETDWTGEERVRFIGDDGKGGLVASNTVSLRVQKDTIPVNLQPYIAIILAVLTILLLLWTISQNNKKLVQHTNRK